MRSPGTLLVLSCAGLALLAGRGPVAGSVQLRGLMETTAREETSAFILNENNRGDNPYDYLRLRLFVEAAPTEELQVHTQFLYNDNYPSGYTVVGAYILYELLDKGGLYVEAGKIPSPFGAYAARSYSDKTPFIATPLMYYYHSTLLGGQLPKSADDLLAVAGAGQHAFNKYPSGTNASAPVRHGLPILYDPCWDLGAVLLGARGTVEYRLGVLGGTPGAPVSGNDSNGAKTVIGRLGWAPRPWLRMGASAARGSYLPESIAGQLDAGGSAEDFHQTLFGYDLEASRGRWIVRSEGVRNAYETPYVGEDLRQTSYFVEVETRPRPGVTLAVRWDEMIYDRITDGAGNKRRWDLSLRRVELAAVYRFTEAFSVKANHQLNSYGAGGFSLDHRISALQLVAGF